MGPRGTENLDFDVPIVILDMKGYPPFKSVAPVSDVGKSE
jgi:hypothetical protein